MQYQKFIIENYRAISGPIEVRLDKQSIAPIIGVNESGKTTILHAIFAFDSHNDTLNGGRHLEDVHNLYSLSSSPPNPLVTAEISIETKILVEAVRAIENTLITEEIRIQLLSWAESVEKSLRLTRNLNTKRYSVNPEFSENEDLNHAVASQIVQHLPYILFFDDFRDSVEDRIEIVSQTNTNPKGWLAILDRLFQEAGGGFSVFALPEMEERNRETLLARVNRHLNQTLTREWRNFKLDESEALEIIVSFEPQSAGSGHLTLRIAETTSEGDRYFFHIRDRSKGFYWFFNFVMKLEFNPKIVDGEETGAVYLLDEPGSYLHPAAQLRLCKKLMQLAEKNRVIYCTHSRHLLDPDAIPLGSIQIANKDNLVVCQG